MKETLEYSKAKYHNMPADTTIYDALQDDGYYYQLVEGVLFVSASPLTIHQRIVSKLSYLINSFLKSHPIGELFIAPLDVEFDSRNIYQPDLFFISQENSDIITEKRIVGVPDFIIEVLSGGTKDLDTGKKQRVYQSSGVLEYWLVDPKSKSFIFYQLQDGRFDKVSISESYTSNVLFPLQITPADFWKFL